MSKSSPHSANRLKDQKSPYLLQHAFNPVDWYPWSSEALERAKKEDKPLFISIGYSSCHWCHVMERESFEDPGTARIMNENFINIKVDREERPDLDSLYMKGVQAITGHAGWPLTIFATPEGVPFYGGTYFPTEDSYGLPSFKKVLMSVVLGYKKNRDRVNAVTSDIEKALRQNVTVPRTELTMEIEENAFNASKLFFDPVYGGFGKGTKFPHAMFLKFLLRYYKRTGVKEAVSIVKKSLSAMAYGGIYDHIGGGFHRYSVDEAWDVPHFEKMLYDNALLLELYGLAYDETQIRLYEDVAAETAAYLLRDMRHVGGGFYSAEDADVEGFEGAYYIWDYDEIRETLGDGAKKFCDYFSITEEGNYEGKNTLRINLFIKKDDSRVPEDIKRLKEALFKARLKRRRPATDRKIITAWNGLAIKGLAQASKSFNRDDFMEEAMRCASFLLSNSIDERGRLLRYYLDGQANVPATLEDYALLGAGLAKIYELTLDKTWLSEAQKLTESMIGLFYDDSERLFYDTGKDQEKLFVRERDLFDNDLPSGNSAAAELLLLMSRFRDNENYRKLAEEILETAEGVKEEPISYGNFLCVLDSLLG